MLYSKYLQNQSRQNIMKLHIIEDDNSLREIYSTLFSVAGHQVKASSNGLDAISEIADFKPDAVLLDIMMPEMDGYAFLDALMNNTSLSPVIIVCSNLSDRTDIDRAMTRGADYYLRKSDYVGNQLVDAVSAAYETARTKHQHSDT